MPRESAIKRRVTDFTSRRTQFFLTLLIAIFVPMPVQLDAADFEKLELSKACSFFGEKLPVNIYQFAAENEAVQIISQIVDLSGLPANFKVKAAGVPNAAAVISKGTRYILYNQAFVWELKQATKSEWSAISVLAHEIGHHLSGHTLNDSDDQLRQELEADRYSGFVLQSMGASLTHAQLTMKLLGSAVASKTHPAKHDRLAAIANGWLAACNKSACDQSVRTKPNINSRTESIKSLPNKPKIGKQAKSINEILMQNSRKFTVQMMANTDRSVVEKFLLATDLNEPNQIFTFERAGTKWYGLLHGVFDSIHAARVHIAQLPPEARGSQAWIRAIGRIQNSIK